MATTVKVDFDGDLLEKLRERRPGKDDRTLLEELARIQLGFVRSLACGAATR